MSLTRGEFDEGFRLTWSLFVALEMGDQETVDAIWDEAGEDVLLRGWHIVAAKLRADLVDHATERGCGCGSEEWL
jgi:hypothetical protein